MKGRLFRLLIVRYAGGMRSAFIGIDVAVAKGKHLPIVVSVKEDGRLIPQRLRSLDLAPPKSAGNLAVLDPGWCQQFAFETRSYVLRVCDRLRLIPTRIGIDGPSSPRPPSTRRRAAEVALDRAGISCFATPSVVDFVLIKAKIRKHLLSGGNEACLPHSNQLWMLAGFAMFETLTEVAECLEVFPQAAIRMTGCGQTHKSKPGAVGQQVGAAAKYTGWPNGTCTDPVLDEIGWGTAHDRLDAYLSSWVSSLSESERTAFGQPPVDAIWVPRLQGMPLQRAPQWESKLAAIDGMLQNRVPTPSSLGKVMCPACGRHPFRRWPWGWDAHAAHKCTGLTDAATPEERKAEFRRRFGEHF